MTSPDNNPVNPIPADLAALSDKLGILQWFHRDRPDDVTRTLDTLDALGVRSLRTGISWADWHAPGGRDWLDGVLDACASRVNLLPCFVYTPPSVGEDRRTNSPPRDLESFGTFVGTMIESHRDKLEWVELWNEPNNMREWDAVADPGHQKFARMIDYAAGVARHHGKKSVLGGLTPVDPNFVSAMHQEGALRHVDAVGVHGFPHSFEFHWPGWARQVQSVRERLDWCGRPDMRIWITETGYSTWRHDEARQVACFLDALRAPVDRVYWYSLFDLHPELPTVDGFHADEREYHFGLHHADGHEKLLTRLWRSRGYAGVQAVAELWRRGGEEAADEPSVPQATSRFASRYLAAPPAPATRSGSRRGYVVITGGAGFVGANLADSLLRDGRDVVVYDNLSRAGSENNARWLRERHGGRVRFDCSDVLDAHALRRAVRSATAVYHFAAQVAVTTSLDDPARDFDVNARGTLNVLEALRQRSEPPPMVFTSTNKVYGDLADLELALHEGRWMPTDLGIRRRGVGEDRPLDFHSPYGCSKGAADQYVLDYARSYDLPTCVLRMSCIYGPLQNGNEDQGWVAHFARAVLADESIVLYGDGRQVRDLLYVDDLVDAMHLCVRRMPAVRGRAFNVGGGTACCASLHDVLAHVASHAGRKPRVEYGPWRVGDQKFYASDTSAFGKAVGWSPTVRPAQGVADLVRWLAPRVQTAGATLPLPTGGQAAVAATPAR